MCTWGLYLSNGVIRFNDVNSFDQMYIVYLTLRTSCHEIPYFFRIFTQVLTFYWLFGKIRPSPIRNKSNFRKKVFFDEVMTERKNWILRIQYMATWHDGTFDVKMMSSEFVRTRHRICRFLRISLVLKINPNTGHTLGTTDKIERRKKWISLKGVPFWLLRLWRLSIVVQRSHYVG